MITLTWTLPESTGELTFPNVGEAWGAVRLLTYLSDPATRAELESALSLNSGASVASAVEGGAAWRYERGGLRVALSLA